MVVAFLLVILIFALLTTLNTGELSNSISSAKADLQSQARRVMDWIIKDTRQTSLIQINNNNPAGNHIKFKQVTGINNATGDYTLSTDFIEYNYDSDLEQLTRSVVQDDGTVLRSWVFSNITESPFYSTAGVALAADAILTSHKLVAVIAEEKVVNVNLTLSFSLTEEIRIRNE